MKPIVNQQQTKSLHGKSAEEVSVLGYGLVSLCYVEKIVCNDKASHGERRFVNAHHRRQSNHG